MKVILPVILVLLQLCWRGVAEPTMVNGVAATVNDSVVTFKEVATLIASDEEFLDRRYARQPELLGQKRRELMERAIEDLVERQLILHEFQTSKYNMPESYIEDMINKDIRNYGNRLTLTKTLQAQGLTFENYRSKVRERIIIQAMSEHNVPHDPTISPHKIEMYYLDNRDKFKVEDQAKLRMIVLTNRPADSIYSAKRLAHEILAKLEEGAPFAEMAKIYSHGSQAIEGGDWGWIERSVLRADLAEEAFALKPGERSSVIEGPDGCYIMLVEETRPAHLRSLGEVRDEVEAALKAQETTRLRKQWIARLKNKSFVRYFTE